MCTTRLKRVYFKISGIDECRHRTVPIKCINKMVVKRSPMITSSTLSHNTSKTLIRKGTMMASPDL